MALIDCTEFGKKISDKATYCVHCGNPDLTPKTMPETDLAQESESEFAKNDDLVKALSDTKVSSERPSQPDEQVGPPLRGALIIFGVFLFLYLLGDLSALGYTKQFINDIEPGTQLADSLSISLSCQKFQALIDFAALLLFGRKSQWFPATFKFSCWAKFCFIVLASFVALTIDGLTQQHAVGIRDLIILNALVFAACVVPWLVYVHRSERVRRTFVREGRPMALGG